METLHLDPVASPSAGQDWPIRAEPLPAQPRRIIAEARARGASMFIPAKYLLAHEVVQRIACSLAPGAMAISKADALKPANFDRQHRAINSALDSLLQALSDGVLTATVLDAQSGGLTDVPSHVWRSDAGREALWWSRLALYPPGRPDLAGAVVFSADDLGKWMEPRESAKVPQSVVNAAALVMAEEHFRLRNEKPFKPALVKALIEENYAVKAAETAYGALPDRLRRGKGEHAARSASQAKKPS